MSISHWSGNNGLSGHKNLHYFPSVFWGYCLIIFLIWYHWPIWFSFFLSIYIHPRSFMILWNYIIMGSNVELKKNYPVNSQISLFNLGSKDFWLSLVLEIFLIYFFRHFYSCFYLFFLLCRTFHPLWVCAAGCLWFSFPGY